MVLRCMEKFKIPLNQHHWVQKWCTDVKHVLAVRKLKCKTATEDLFGRTPDFSVFRFYVWESILYYKEYKVSHPVMMPGRFLGITWNHGDAMTYYVQSEPDNGSKPLILMLCILQKKGNQHNKPGSIQENRCP